MKKKILIVDDNRLMRFFLGKRLRKEGHDVSTAYDGYQALKNIINDPPEVIFIDLVMPKIDGGTLCQMIRKMPHMDESYLVVISAALAEMDFDYQKVGADACIVKGPFEKMAEHLLRAVADADAPKQERQPRPIMGMTHGEDGPLHPRRMTMELLSRTRHLESILDSLQEGVLELYSNDIVYANARTESIFGLQKEDLMAKDFVKLFHPMDRSRVRALLKKGAGQLPEIGPDNPVAVNGRQLSIKIRSRKGKVLSSVLTVTDVTRLNNTSFLRRHNEKRTSLSRLAGKTSGLIQSQASKIKTAGERLVATAPGTATLKTMKRIEKRVAEITDLCRQLSCIAAAGSPVDGAIKAAAHPGEGTILIVSGEKLICEMDRLTIEELGYKVLVAKTAGTAISKYQARSKKKYNNIDLVIVDQMVPGMTVAELIAALKRIDPKVPIMVSGKPTADPSAPQQTPPAGAIGFLTSPLAICRLSAELGRAFGGDNPSSTRSASKISTAPPIAFPSKTE